MSTYTATLKMEGVEKKLIFQSCSESTMNFSIKIFEEESFEEFYSTFFALTMLLLCTRLKQKPEEESNEKANLSFSLKQEEIYCGNCVNKVFWKWQSIPPQKNKNPKPSLNPLLLMFAVKH